MIMKITNLFYLKIAIICLVVSAVSESAVAQMAIKREMRGVWIATVMNIDYPSSPTTDVVKLQENWLRILDNHRSQGLNALFVQVRPVADALYPSALVPWSSFLGILISSAT
jgi:uncharacterized lipoprotein YddW (UPF0748 family)